MGMIVKPPLGSLPYYGHPLTKGLVGGWPKNEGGGNKVFDLSGNNNTGTITGADWQGGKFGPTLYYYQTDYCTIPNNNGLNEVFDVGKSWTIVVWFKITATGTGWSWIWCKGYTSYASPYYQVDIRYDEGGSLDYTMWNSTGGVYLESNSDVSVSENIWYQAAMTYNGTQLVAYLDGRQIGQDSTAVGTYANYDTPISLGSYLNLINASFGFMGQIDNNLIFNRALSASEIAQLYREPFCMFEQPHLPLIIGATSGEAPTGNAGIMTTWGGYWGATY